MAERKPTPRSTILVAGAVGGGIISVTLGQKFSSWALESQTNSLILVGAGAVVGGIVAWLATAKRRS